MESALLNNEPISFLPFFKQSVVYGLHNRIMQALDDGEHLAFNRNQYCFVCIEFTVACRTDNPLRLCRMYACIADVLGMMAAGGIRGGPAANISFKKAFALLEVSIWNDVIVCILINATYKNELCYTKSYGNTG